MSYNKFLNKILNNQSNGNVLAFNTQNQSLSFKNNIQISQLQNENIKIESNDLSTLVFSKVEGINSALAFQENLNYSKLKISDFSFENSGDNKLFLLKNENSKTRVNSDLEISSSDFKAKKIYGNLTYVDKERTIPWLSGSNNETVKVSFNPTGGYTINKQNINLNNTTYITCNPDDGFSNYPKTDIVGEQSNGYNFVNELGSYTNILYLRPGLNSNNKSRYLSSNEHTFIIDVQKSKLPGWGFEENHPLRKMASYNSLYNTIMNSNNLQNQLKSQSIAIDLSDLVNSNSISPGYKINFYLTNIYTPMAQPCIFHSDTNISLTQSDWDQYTFDSRYCNFTKNDYILNNSLRDLNSFNFNITASYPDSKTGARKSLSIYSNLKYYLNPYLFDQTSYDSVQTFNVTYNYPNPYKTTTAIMSTSPFSYLSQYTPVNKLTLSYADGLPPRKFYLPVGDFCKNKYTSSYYKSFFYFNLGKDNEILNEKNIPSLGSIKKNIENFKINHVPYLTNSTDVSIPFSNILNSNNEYNYFIDYKKTTGIENSDIFFDHLNLNDQKIFSNEISYSVPSTDFSYNFNCFKNLTCRLNISNFQKIKDNFLTKIFLRQECNADFVAAKYVIILRSNKYSNPDYKYINIYRCLLKSTNVLVFPFSNLTKSINSNDSNHHDWRYIEQWQTKENICNIQDLSIKDNNEEKKFIYDISNQVTSPYPLTVFDQTKNYIVNENTRYQFSLMYIGFNSTTNKHEWVYV